jgi:hypothetical protein
MPGQMLACLFGFFNFHIVRQVQAIAAIKKRKRWIASFLDTLG